MPSSDPCNFSTLAMYNSGSSGINIVQIPVVDLNTRNIEEVDFTYRAPGYNTISVARPYNCSGFANISNAYSRFGNNCNQQYVRRICN